MNAGQRDSSKHSYTMYSQAAITVIFYITSIWQNIADVYISFEIDCYSKFPLPPKQKVSFVSLCLNTHRLLNMFALHPQFKQEEKYILAS